MWLPMILAACRRTAPPDVFPESVAGAWKRSALQERAGGEAPDPVPQTSIRRWQAAVYEGPGKLEARCYELSSSAVALDVVQRWRPAPDTVFFHRGRYFVVVHWTQADRGALQAFVRELESRLPADH
jgi:hypothetical protein